MEHKNLVATLFLKNGVSVTDYHSDKPTKDDIHKLVKIYDDSGVDKILIFDLSDTEAEHEMNLHVIREINHMVQIPVCAGGNINSLEDIRKLLYTGCQQVVLNADKPKCVRLAQEGAKRFGKEKITVSLMTVDILFKHLPELTENIDRLFVLNESIIDAVDNVTKLPFTALVDGYDLDHIVNVLKKESVVGIAGAFINDAATDIMKLKQDLAAAGVPMNKFEPLLHWSDLKLNSDGMVPVVVQDYRTNEVLMVAYMNEEAFQHTIECGRMTYYSRSRQELWEKGLTSGHFQYVKSLTADCDYDTILAKVSQVGAACHTGKYSCFFNEIAKKEFQEKNTQAVFDTVYQTVADRKVHPKEGSYSNALFEKGIDNILKMFGKEATEIIIAAKNPDTEQLKSEISDLLYYIMVLMVQRGITWDDITDELVHR
ncbi:MAG: bifunctional phosphoribosyl-AMP cyclohydrolase/phosphoribosyl-ATP diphosphatase HisIE [Lachnospiraceae bacterium]